MLFQVYLYLFGVLSFDVMLLFVNCFGIMLDIFFAIQAYMETNWNSPDLVHLTVFCLSVFFIIVPIFTNFYQLHNEIQEWVTDIETRLIVQAWIQLHLRPLYTLSICLGSAFSAVEICNSNLFSLSVFNMGLNRSFVYIIIC